MPVSARRRNIAALRLPSIDSRKRDSSPGVQTVISGARARAVVSDGALARRATLRVTTPVRSASLSSLLSAAWTWCTLLIDEATAAATARPQQLGVQRVEVGGAQLLQRRAAEPGQHVVREHACGSPAASTACGLGWPTRRATARRTRPASCGSGRRSRRSGGRRGSGSARPARRAWCGTPASADGVDRPLATWRGRPTTTAPAGVVRR